MKILKYNLLQSVTESGETILAEKTMSWSEANEENAKREAYKGEYTIEDDGQPEPEAVETMDDVLNALLGVTV